MAFEIEGLPEQVRVGAFWYDIVMEDADWAACNQAYGQHSSIRQRITFMNPFSSPEKALDVVMHELCHAVVWVFDIKTDDPEERIVVNMARGLSALMIDNPDVVSWLDRTAAAARR